MLKNERAERERLLEEERRSRLELRQTMMAKFAQLSQQMGTHQMIIFICLRKLVRFMLQPCIAKSALVFAGA